MKDTYIKDKLFDRESGQLSFVECLPTVENLRIRLSDGNILLQQQIHGIITMQ